MKSRSDQMDVAWSVFTKPDGTSHRRVEISKRADWALFERVADLLLAHLGGAWVERLDGLDQRYWDWEAHRGKLTLHLEHDLGISVYPTDGSNADEESLALLQSAYDLLAKEAAA